MKLVLVLLLPLFLSTLSGGQVASTAVRDVLGDDLQPGVDYYILPFRRGRGGGLTLKLRNDTCPFNVAQESLEVDSGLPVTFSPVEPNDQTIQLSTDLNIQFSAATICVQSTLWTLQLDESTGISYVSTGGVKGSPGRETLSNWFKIKTYEGNDTYKLVFCPTVCSICRPRCGDLGVFLENGGRWLGVGGEPFPVIFAKVQGGGIPSIVSE